MYKNTELLAMSSEGLECLSNEMLMKVLAYAERQQKKVTSDVKRKRWSELYRRCWLARYGWY